MFFKSGSSAQKVWSRFSKTGELGMKRFRFEKLQEDRFEDFLDFKMKYYVKHEITHAVSGMHKNPKAIEEYRQIISTNFKNPSYEIAVCHLDDEENHDIIAFSAVKLYQKGDVYKDTIKAVTNEVNNFFKILHDWNSLCPVPDILDNYGVDTFYEDAGFAVDPKYKGYGITQQTCRMRNLQCKEHGVRLTGAWMTALATQISAQRDGWTTIYKISSEQLERKLGISFGDAPPYFKYMILKVS